MRGQFGGRVKTGTNKSALTALPQTSNELFSTTIFVESTSVYKGCVAGGVFESSIGNDP